MKTVFNNSPITPLAERMRPRSLGEFVGQRHVVGNNKFISTLLSQKRVVSMLLWGDPGTGKTTLARIIAEELNIEAHFLSAISSGVADVRKILEKGARNRVEGKQTLLFLDEIHRFNKAQQDSILSAVEAGDVVLIGATTENPSFEIIPPLLSRMRVVKLEPLDAEALGMLIERALSRDELLKEKKLEEEARELLIMLSLIHI
ncbi:MAG: AAA family ATPase, partial [Spirochaetes bacterium]|nr:AAA family ATPase [Spirochaetota bacterium]